MQDQQLEGFIDNLRSAAHIKGANSIHTMNAKVCLDDYIADKYTLKSEAPDPSIAPYYDENGFLTHPTDGISVQKGEQLFDEHVTRCLEKVDQSDPVSVAFFHNSIAMAATVLIELPIRRECNE